MGELIVRPSTELVVPPTYAWVPEYTSTEAAQEAAELAESIGLVLEPEQRYALDVLLAERDDRWAALEAAVVCGRQNLKTFIFKVIALYELFVVGSRLLVWTAHEFNTAMEAFRDLRELIEGSWMDRKVASVNEANGKEGIELTTGQRIRFKARTKIGGRGLSGDVTFLDEAFALQPHHVGSLLPTMAARSVTGNPRIYYGSSAGQLQSSVLRGIRDRGRPGGDPSLAYVEWCAPTGGCADPDCMHLRGTEGCAADDIETIRLGNPLLERRISIEFIEAMRRSLPVDEFIREFMVWWEDPVAGTSGIPEAEWEACGQRAAVLDDTVVVGLDVAPDFAYASIVACSGPVHVAEHHPSSAWILDDDSDRSLHAVVRAHKVEAVVVDPTGPVGGMIPDLEAAGFTIRSKTNPKGLLVLLDGREQQQACEALLAAVLDGSFVHRDQLALNAAAMTAGRRKVGDSWKWSRLDSTVDISPLVAATNARFWWSKPSTTPTPSVGGAVDQDAYEAALRQIREEDARALEALRSR